MAFSKQSRSTYTPIRTMRAYPKTAPVESSSERWYADLADDCTEEWRDGRTKASDLDATDRQVLRELQTDARLAYKELGRRVGLSASAVIERVRKMEDAGVITGYHAAVDAAKLGLPIE